MNAGDQLWLSQHQQVGGISQIDRMIFESLTAIASSSGYST
jgi:hypothetical protein